MSGGEVGNTDRLDLAGLLEFDKSLPGVNDGDLLVDLGKLAVLRLRNKTLTGGKATGQWIKYKSR